MAEGSSSGWSEFGKVSLEELLGEDWHYFVPEEPVGPFPAIKLPIPKLEPPQQKRRKAMIIYSSDEEA